MTIFLDTSSLFKLYVQESGSDELIRFFDKQPIEQVYLSELAIVEFHATVWRKVRMGEITADDARLLLNAFDTDCLTYSFVPITHSLLRAAQQLLSQYGPDGLRSLDAIQLAAAVSIRQDAQVFKTADALLHTFFIAESLSIDI